MENQKSKRVSLSPDTEKSSSRRPKKPQLGNLVELWSAQCGECLKWRLIPTEEEFEELRSRFTEDPFVCAKIPGISCHDHAEIEMDSTRTWVIHRPGVPRTPAGFKRRVILRRDLSKTDCYYDAPNGKRLRAMTDVAKFLDSHPQYKEDLSVEDFSFSGTKVLEETVPPNLGKKV